MKYKPRILSMLMLLSMTLSSAVYAEQSPSPSASPSNATVYNGPSEYSPRVTVLQCINFGLSNCYYAPKIAELPELDEYVSKEGKFGTVYGGYWDLDYQSPFNANGSNRVYETLGYDIILSGESYSFSGDTGTYNPIVATSVTEDYAMMCIYKALNKMQYDYTYKSYPNPDLTLETSPLSHIITIPVSSLDASEGLTKVFVSRTNSDQYWKQAKKDRLVLSDGDRYEPLTVAEFCLLVKQAMYNFGEPVLIEEEENYLLEVYGKTLPHSVSAVELEAIKYLLARGIIDTNYSFQNQISVEAMLDILMKVADVDSRATFKNLTLTYDKTLLSKGYYPTDVYATEAGISEVGSAFNYETATHFDYFVKRVEGKTVFLDANRPGEEAQIIYVSSKPDDVSETPLEGSTYLGLENGYYHFRVPAYVADTSLSGGYITINSSNPYDKPENYMLEAGGGWYQCSEDNYRFKREAFTTWEDSSYVDIDRKLSAQKALKTDVKLFDITKGSYEVVLRIPDTMKNKIKYDGKPFADCLTAGTIKLLTATTSTVVKLTAEDKATIVGTSLYLFSGLKTADELKDKLVIESAINEKGAKVDVYQAYGRAGKDLLVNVDYLKAMGLISGYDWVTADIILLYSSYQNTYIDTAANRIVNGTTVTDVSSNTPLVTKVKEQLFVDYRAVLGWSVNYLQFKDEDGNITVSTNKTSSKYAHTYALDPFGSALEYVSTQDGKISLESSYPLNSYFVYRCRDTAKETGDWIFSFKLKTPQVNIDDSAARSIFTTKLALEPPEEWLVYYSTLYASATSTQNPKGITYTANGYVFEPTNKTNFSQYAYYGTGKTPTGQQLIPLYTDDKKLRVYDFNLNLYCPGSAITYGKLPAYFCRPLETDTNAYWDCGTAKKLSPDSAHPEWTSVSDSNKIKAELIPAPVGVTVYLLDMDDTEVPSTGSTSRLYYGTMPGTLTKVNGRNILTSTNPSISYTADELGANFMTLFRRENSRVMCYAGEEFQAAAITEEEEEDKISVKLEEALAAFDWENFTFKTFIESFDDMLTIAVLFVLNILPRFFMFLFMILLTLSCIAKVKVWQKFCTTVFDPYKLITAGRQTVNTINIQRMFVVSILALAGFGLFQNGMILDLIAWIARAITGILTR